MCGLRELIRQRDMLISYRSSHIQHMQKSLEQMNLKLTVGVADITGGTGLTRIRTILAGEHDPQALARYRHPSCARNEEEIAKALDGNYRSEHLFRPLQENKSSVGAYGEWRILFFGVKHFTSWLNLCPNNQITGGKVINRTRKKQRN